MTSILPYLIQKKVELSKGKKDSHHDVFSYFDFDQKASNYFKSNDFKRKSFLDKPQKLKVAMCAKLQI